jgi:hypothetical protein
MSHLEEDCWKKCKDLSNDEMEATQTNTEGPKRSTYVTYTSLTAKNAESLALIDSGAVYTIIGSKTLDKIMGFYGIVRVEKCQTLSLWDAH